MEERVKSDQDWQQLRQIETVISLSFPCSPFPRSPDHKGEEEKQL